MKSPKRNHGLEELTQRQILDQHIDVQENENITAKRLLKEGNIVIVTNEGDQESLLNHDYHLTPETVIKKIEERNGNLIILPEEFRLPKEEVHQKYAYDFDSLMRLDHPEILDNLGIKTGKEKIRLGSKRLSGRALEKYRVSIEELMKAWFRIDSGDPIEDTKLLFAWYGTNGERRLVSPYRSHLGLRALAWNDIVYWKLIDDEIRTKRSVETGEKLDEKQLQKRIQRRNEYYRTLNNKEILQDILKLNVTSKDLIIPERKSARRGTIRAGKIPSSDRTHYYSGEFTHIPSVGEYNPRKYSLLLNLNFTCNDCKDPKYRSDRRSRDPYQGQDEIFFCRHAAALYLSMQRTQEKDEGRRITVSPFPLPANQKQVQFVDSLENHAILLTENKKTNRNSIRPLNHTEIENLMVMRARVRGYSEVFTTDRKTYNQQGYDPRFQLIHFQELI